MWILILTAQMSLAIAMGPPGCHDEETANEALADPNRIILDPDPASEEATASCSRVVLDLECLDRVHFSGYVPNLQVGGAYAPARGSASAASAPAARARGR